MTKQILFFIVVILLLSHTVLAQETDKESGNIVPFAVAEVQFEQNATDGDVEVVFEVKGGDEGLTNLTVISPDGRTIGDFTAPDASTMGIRQFRFESPEPTDVDALKTAYPEGIYTFAGATVGGTEYYSETTLNHNLPPAVSFLQPGADAEEVKIDNLEITWTPVENLAAYIIEIDQEELGVNMLIKLPGSVNKFPIPDGFLRPGEEYTLSIGTVSEVGNISVVETTFTTAGEE
ncbi:MAG: hypothetical protein WBH40_10510 [Ignavibacteriaceae bacterium]